MPFLAEAMRALRAGRRDGRGHRCRRARRPQPPDGPARAGRLHRPRRLPRVMRVLEDGLGQRTSGRRASWRARRRGPSRPEDRPRLPHLPAMTAAPGLGDLSSEERLLRDTARAFARDVVAPGAGERDETETFDRSIFARMGALGLTAAPFAAERWWRRLLVSRLDARHGGDRGCGHGISRDAVGPRPPSVPGRHVRDGRAAWPLAAGHAGR